ncbi:DUF4349 domain-containing protein [bacterium]|nr:DUF4349 domain-containing protein [bacterium]
MKCPKVRDNIKAFIDGELNPISRTLIARHIRQCAGCRAEEAAMRELSGQVKNSKTYSAPKGLREKVLSSINFEPAERPRLRWPYTTRPVSVALVMLVTIALAAVVVPMFNNGQSRSSEAKKYSLADRKLCNQAVPAALPPPAQPRSKIAAKQSRAYEKKVGAVRDMDLNIVGRIDNSNADVGISQVIVKTANMSMRVKNAESAGDKAVDIAKSLGGYVSDSSLTRDAGSSTSETMIIRVPVSSFERAIERLSALGKITSKSINGEDVTGELVDLESRLRNKRAEERQYLEIMNKAHRINDIITVSNELYRVRGEIEETAGRIKYLKSTAAMSTIDLTLDEKAKAKPVQSQIHKSMTGAVASLGRTISSIAGLLIWLAVYSPFWAIPILVALYYRRRNLAAQD